MNDKRQYIDDYLLEEHYAACKEFLYDVLDWDLMDKRIRAEGVIHFDISNVMELFPHLTLDEEYKLICYLSREYHGIWGRIAAIKNGDPCDPVINPEDEWLSELFHGQHFELPESAAPPMEAIYNDGSPHGYLEALLAEEFLGAIPYTYFEQEHWDWCIFRYPEGFPSDWDIYENVSDLRPHITTTRLGGVVVTVYWHHFENGFGSSDGCDEIRLSQHEFSKDLSLRRFWTRTSNSNTMYKAQIDDDSRYREGRHCCVSTEHKITIAVQKEWQTLERERNEPRTH